MTLVDAVKALVTTNYIRLGGTGGGWNTPHSRDVVYADILSGGLSAAGVKVTADKALGYIPFFAAVRAISEDVASLPLNVYRNLPEGGKSKDEGHAVQRLLHDQANPYMTAFAFRETLQAHVLTWGNGYAEIEFATDGEVLNLWPLRPDRMTVFIEDNKVMYRYVLRDGRTTDLPKRKVLHIHGLGWDGLTGYSVIEKARHTLGMALASEEYGEGWFERGGIPPAVMTHPKTLSDTARKNLRESWDENHGSLANKHRIAILEEGLDLKVLGVPPKDAAFIEALGHNRSMMATLFRMPPVMLGDVERTTSWGTGVEQQKLGYASQTLRAWLVRWEQQGKAQLLAGEDRYLKHVLDGFLRGDTAARWSAYNAGLDRGVYSIDDVLEMEDRNPLPDGAGKRHFVPLNMAPLDQVGEMTMVQRLDALRGLVTAGIAPEPAAELAGIEDTAPLEPAMAGANGHRS